MLLLQTSDLWFNTVVVIADFRTFKPELAARKIGSFLNFIHDVAVGVAQQPLW
jgi:hypothetical protein